MIVKGRHACAVVLSLTTVASLYGQDTFEKLEGQFQGDVLQKQNRELLNLESPDVTQLIQLAEGAMERISAEERGDHELRTVARKLESKLNAIATNDLGRFMATNPSMVGAVIGFESDAAQLSERGLGKRYQRLREAMKSLKPVQGRDPR